MSYQLARRGMGEYEQSGDWSWEFFPPPYDFLAPADSAPQPAPILGGGGLGCTSCGGGCGCSQDQGLGQTGFLGTGLFASANPATWGIGEYATLGVGAYLAFSLVGDAGTVSAKGKQAYRRARSSAGAGSVGTLLLVGALAYGGYYFWNQYQTTGAL